MSDFENIIKESFDDFYINWDPCFDKDIINIINRNSLKKTKGDTINDNEKLLYDLKRLYQNSNYKDNMKIIIKSDNLDLTYNFKSIIGSGSCGYIFQYDKINHGKKCYNSYVLKFGLDDEENTTKCESTLHYILDKFQNIIIKSYRDFECMQIIPNLDLILLTKDNFYHIIMEKVDYELGSFFNKFNPLLRINYSKNHKLSITNEVGEFIFWNIYLEFLLQMSVKLILLQDNFKFMHNDLKCNNILVKAKNDRKRLFDSYSTNNLDYTNLCFLMCDLGGASYIYGGKKYEGTILGSNSKFNRCKDLFHLVHMHLAFSEFREQLISFIKFFEIFELDYKLISRKKENWLKIYTYVEDGNKIHNSFNPRILKEKLIKISKYSKEDI